MSIRAKYLSGCLLALSAFLMPAHAAKFDRHTAPDQISRDILTKPLTRLQEGTAPGVDPSYQIHRNFPQIIEQNFARLDTNGMQTLIDALSDQELSDLAQLYVNAVTDNGQILRVLSVMADRLDFGRLARVSKHFGFLAVHGAISAVAPGKVHDFLSHSSPTYQGPTPGEARFGPAGRYTPAAVTGRSGMVRTAYYGGRARFIKVVGLGPYLDMTPYEIYLSFRTAPIGALSVRAALYEMTVLVSKGAIGAYTAGYEVGTHYVLPAIQTYAPDLYDSIGGTIGTIVENLYRAPDGTATNGKQEQLTAQPGNFGLSNSVGNQIGNTGGDYECAWDWTYFGGYSGGGGCSPMTCFKPTNAY